MTIGNNVWIGCRCLILKGSHIPDNCVVGANSLVSKRLETKSAVYGGEALRILKEEIIWEGNCAIALF
ncbi:acyltransferase [Sphingobacterium thalpophilum]|uniref:acyltransferase n=1 Tax=Sphingobacterium thalpophilum TaxID=259 RepID=UPI00396F493B